MVAKLARAGKVSSVITRNVDGPHHASGIADEPIIELHGNGTYAKWLTCETRYELAPIGEELERDLLVPVYGWFTECFGNADPMAAKALLDELS